MNVVVQVLGGDKKVLDNVDTVADVRSKLNIESAYQASVNDEEADDSYDLGDNDFVTFTEKVKGGKA